MRGEPKHGMNGAEFVNNSFWGSVGPMLLLVAGVAVVAMGAVWWFTR